MPSYFASPTGNGSGSQSSPFSLTSGLSVLVPGDSLILRGGTYPNTLFNAVPGGLAAAPITISAYPSETVTLQPLVGAIRVISLGSLASYINFLNLVLDGVNVSDDGVKITSGANHIVLEGCEIKNVPNGHGIIISGPSDSNVIRRCSIHDNGQNDLQHQLYIQTANNLVSQCHIYGGFGYAIHQFDGIVTGNIYSRNRIHDTFGILVSSGSGNKIHYNLLYSNLGDISVQYSESGAEVFNNTCFDGTRGIYTDPTTFGAIIRNNISYLHTDNNGDFIDDGSGTIASNNLFGVDPLFVNSGTQDFHLLALSPAINGGVGVGLTEDYDGVAVGSAPDIGAFEYVAPPVVVGPGSGGGHNKIPWGQMKKMLLDRLDSKGIFYKDTE